MRVSTKPKDKRWETTPHQTTMTKLAGLFEAVHRPLNPEEAEPLSGRVGFDEGKEEKTRLNCGGVRVDIDFDLLVVEERGAAVEVSEVDRPKDGILGHNSIEGDVEGRQRGGVGRRRAEGREAVTTRSSAQASQDVGVERAEVAWGEERGFLLYGTVIVCGGGETDVHSRAEGVSGLYQLN